MPDRAVSCLRLHYKRAVSCDSSCATCTSGSSCASCSGGSSVCSPLQLLTLHSQLVGSNRCCSNTCSDCNFGTPNTCTACISGKYLSTGTCGSAWPWLDLFTTSLSQL